MIANYFEGDYISHLHIKVSFYVGLLSWRKFWTERNCKVIQLSSFVLPTLSLLAYRRYLEVRYPMWGDGWSHSLLQTISQLRFSGVFLSYKVDARRSVHLILNPIMRNRNRSWWHRHTSINIFWPQSIAPWTTGKVKTTHIIQFMKSKSLKRKQELCHWPRKEGCLIKYNETAPQARVRSGEEERVVSSANKRRKTPNWQKYCLCSSIHMPRQ